MIVVESVRTLGDATFTCARCFYTGPLTPDLRFCPRCGLADVGRVSADGQPLAVNVGRQSYQVLDRIAVGSIATVYRCAFSAGSKRVEGTFKIARDARTNDLILNEAQVLRRLRAVDAEARFTPFFPTITESIPFPDQPPGPSRHANILRMHEEIRSPADELYTLAEVREQYPAGLDGRDVAWIWRRLLSVLGFIHTHDVVHAAVLPMHVLIEPREHKLVLVDWCCAVSGASADSAPLRLITGGYTPWYKREGALKQPPTPTLDIALAARCMIELMGGDPVAAQLAPAVDPALLRYFRRCVETGSSGARPDAWKLLEDFDRLIEALWGPREFRVFKMPPKGKLA